MALLIANEWENQSDVLKQHSLPVVRRRVLWSRSFVLICQDFTSIKSDRRP